MPLQTKGDETYRYLGPCMTEFLTGKLLTQPGVEVIEPEVLLDIIGNRISDSRKTLSKLLAGKGIEYFVSGWIETKDGTGTVDLALIDSETGRILLEYGPKQESVDGLTRIIDAFVSKTSSILERNERVPRHSSLKFRKPVENVAKLNSDIRTHPDLWFKASLPGSGSQQPEHSLPPAANSLPFPPPAADTSLAPSSNGIHQQVMHQSHAPRINKPKKETAVEKAHKRGWFSKIFMPWKNENKTEEDSSTSPAQGPDNSEHQPMQKNEQQGKGKNIQKWEWY